jgi:hypothetical protein
VYKSLGSQPVLPQVVQLGEPLVLPRVQVVQLELLVQREVLPVLALQALLQLAQLVRHRIRQK